MVYLNYLKICFILFKLYNITFPIEQVDFKLNNEFPIRQLPVCD